MCRATIRASAMSPPLTLRPSDQAMHLSGSPTPECAIRMSLLPSDKARTDRSSQSFQATKVSGMSWHLENTSGQEDLQLLAVGSASNSSRTLAELAMLV